MHRRPPVLAAGDVEGALLEVEHVPAHADELRGSEAVPVGEEDHGRVAVGVAARVLLGGGQALDLLGGEELARADVAFLVRRGTTVRFSMVGLLRGLARKPL